MKFSIVKQTLVGFGIALAVMSGINALSYWSLVKHKETARWVTHTRQVLKKLEATLLEVTNAETGQRGYLITGEDSYLEPFYSGVASVNQQIKELLQLTADNPNQQRRLNILKPLVTQKVAELYQTIDLRQDKGFDAARAVVKTERGKELMARIRQIVREMEGEENSLLLKRINQEQAAANLQNLVFSIGTVFNLLVFYSLYRAISREINHRRQVQVTVQKANEHLEQKVKERTAELAQANQSLYKRILDQQQAEIALQDSNNLLRTVIDSSPHPIFVKDLQGRYQLINIVGANRFNKSVEEVIGLDSSVLFPPEWCAKFQADEQRILTTGQAETIEETIPIGSEWRTYLTNSNVYRDSEGNIKGIVGFARDITLFKQAQEALRQANEELEQRVRRRTAQLEKANAALVESEALMRLFIENAPSAIAMFDHQMHYLAVSRRWRSDYNLSEQEIIGRSHYEVFPEIPAQWKQDYQNVLAGAVVKSEEDSLIRADGTTEWIRYEAHPWRNITGEVGGLIMFTEVITHRKLSEQKLQQLNAELVRSNTELEQFAYIASHDLREPLRKIKSYTELLAEDYQGQLDEKADKYMAYISDGAERMQALISDLLTYSRVTKGELIVEPTNLEAIVKQTLEDLSLVIKENNALITVKPLPTLKANRQQMAQLFQNLIANALKYRSQATPETLIQAEFKDNEWVISVQDNGIGIKPQYFERIFAIFQRLHNRNKYSGTGIGLAICRKIVERHGGRIWLESQEGIGSTFYFTLPMH